MTTDHTTIRRTSRGIVICARGTTAAMALFDAITRDIDLNTPVVQADLPLQDPRLALADANCKEPT